MIVDKVESEHFKVVSWRAHAAEEKGGLVLHLQHDRTLALPARLDSTRISNTAKYINIAIEEDSYSCSTALAFTIHVKNEITVMQFSNATSIFICSSF